MLFGIAITTSFDIFWKRFFFILLCLWPVGSQDVLTSDDFREVYSILHDVRDKWRYIGLELGLKRSDLNNIEKDYGSKGNERCLEEMVAKWISMRSLVPTWKSLVRALNAKGVEEEGLADDINESKIKSTQARSKFAILVQNSINYMSICLCVTHMTSPNHRKKWCLISA